MNKIKFIAILALVMGLSLATGALAQTALTATMLGPVANQTYTAGQPVPFGALASGGQAPYAYVWDFGDSTTGVGQSFDKSFTQVGVRTIKLTVNDAASNQAIVTRQITIASSTATTTTDVLTISNLRVTDVTSSSVIVRWTTNLAADSRVIYDSVSHSSIAGQSTPNYGYATSTTSSDASPKVTDHAVTVSGLTASTTYYFRAISQS